MKDKDTQLKNNIEKDTRDAVCLKFNNSGPVAPAVSNHLGQIARTILT